MGGSSSKDKATERPFAERVKAGVETEIARRMMIQREMQMALNIAKARDNLQIFGSLWLTLVSGAGAAKIAGRAVPGMVGIPIVVGGVLLSNLADLAYGNKLQRVCNEVEYILDNEQARFVPFPQVSSIFLRPRVAQYTLE
jgi:UDP-N-acetylenolpyruvoylglucosamine reductase